MMVYTLKLDSYIPFEERKKKLDSCMMKYVKEKQELFHMLPKISTFFLLQRMHFEEPTPRALFPLNFSKGCLPITFNIVIQSFLRENKVRKAIELV